MYIQKYLKFNNIHHMFMNVSIPLKIQTRYIAFYYSSRIT